VSVYGATSPQHGTFSVQVDDQTTVQMNGSAPTFRPQTLLVSPRSSVAQLYLISESQYWAGSLGPGQHNVTLTNTDSQLNFDFDDLVASTWTIPAATAPSPTPTHA